MAYNMTEFKNSDWVDAYFEKGIDVVNRRVFLGDIEADTIDWAIKGVYLMETNDNESPIELFISSFGGDVYESLALYDIMQTVKCPIHTFAYGKCMSAAPLLLAAGEPGQRWVAPHVALMHHDGASTLEGKGASLLEDVKHTEKLNKQWTELLAGHSNKNFKWWNDRAKRQADFYFSAEEAITWGIADAIWNER